MGNKSVGLIFCFRHRETDVVQGDARFRGGSSERVIFHLQDGGKERVARVVGVG